MRIIEPSELIINEDGSIFHLHLKPEQLADTIILVGDPGRVDMVCEHFNKIEHEARNREFVSKTGYYKEKRFTVVSTGIGTDNIDIVLNELDALANIDLVTRTVKPTRKQLTLLRLGTSGGLQPHLPVGSFVMSDISIGFDGLLNFYAGRNEVCRLDMEKAFTSHMNWSPLLAAPYFIESSKELINLFGNKVNHGMTISSPGFYGPQGRVLRLPLSDPDMNQKIEAFRFEEHCITNFEMESSAIAGLSKLLGHRASTICTIIANRVAKNANSGYKNQVKQMIEMALNELIKLEP